MFSQYKKIQPSIKDLVKKSLTNSVYRSYWEKSILVTAWHKMFPHMQRYLKDLSIRNKIVYVQLESLIWGQELRRNREQILIKFQKIIAELTEETGLVKNMIFL